MLRFLLLSILLTIVFRAVSRLLNGVARGMQGPGGRTARGPGDSRVPQQGVHMERDPVCGTFVVPERAVALSASGGDRLYFCSTDCRDQYRNRPETGSSAAHGRTA
jgi:YHS domain-containing protein